LRLACVQATEKGWPAGPWPARKQIGRGWDSKSNEGAIAGTTTVRFAKFRSTLPLRPGS
jgi:hypothetical protein